MIEEHLIQPKTPICVIRISKEEVLHLKLLSVHLGKYPQLLMGNSIKK